MKFPAAKDSGQASGTARGLREASVWRRLAGAAREQAEFARAFLKSPATVGAIAPSSRALARAMIAGGNLAEARLVVELGPGTGALSRVILESIGPDTTFLALELSAPAAVALQARYPRIVVVNDSAERVDEHVSRRNPGGAEYLVSGLPWAIMPAPLQERILAGVRRSLAPGGRFTTFAYLHARWFPSAMRFRRLLTRFFPRVEVSAVVWRNLPPAVVYRSVKS